MQPIPPTLPMTSWARFCFSCFGIFLLVMTEQRFVRVSAASASSFLPAFVSASTKAALFRGRQNISSRRKMPTITTLGSKNYGDNMDMERRKLLQQTLVSSLTTTCMRVSIPGPARAIESSSSNNNTTTNNNNNPMSPDALSPLPSRVDLPLEFISTLNAYVVHFYLLGERFGAIVDTGSPFLTVPSYCQPYRVYKYRWGCYRPERTQDSGYANSIVEMDNTSGTVVWRKGAFSFDGGRENDSDDDDDDENKTFTKDSTSTDLVFGVLDEALMNGPGGVFFGLLKETTAKRVRPSFLGQTGYTSFCVDLRSDATGRRPENDDDKTTDDNLNNITPQENLLPAPRLILSKDSLLGVTTLPTNAATAASEMENQQRLDSAASAELDYIPLVKDLNRRYNVPVVHYTARASRLVVNGRNLLPRPKSSLKRQREERPFYVILDTGVSGMVVSQELFDERYQQARRGREKSLWGEVRVSLPTKQGNEVELVAYKPVTTPLGKSWPSFRGDLIVLGLAFLRGYATTVDIQGEKLWISE